jgi:ketol-acid reductoisomerase
MAKIYYQSDCNLAYKTVKPLRLLVKEVRGTRNALTCRNARQGGRRPCMREANPGRRLRRPDSRLQHAADAAKAADIIMILVPDEKQADIYTKASSPI